MSTPNPMRATGRTRRRYRTRCRRRRWRGSSRPGRRTWPCRRRGSRPRCRAGRCRSRRSRRSRSTAAGRLRWGRVAGVGRMARGSARVEAKPRGGPLTRRGIAAVRRASVRLDAGDRALGRAGVGELAERLGAAIPARAAEHRGVFECGPGVGRAGEGQEREKNDGGAHSGGRRSGVRQSRRWPDGPDGRADPVRWGRARRVRPGICAQSVIAPPHAAGPAYT
ncbi:hypothetical protein DFJ74DRAFT_673851 [Hyaloraphidium curvatum]|nr:hypothetical protein DFJ74DRAFT_673851 [Hyaloraphidium curvatum]